MDSRLALPLPTRTNDVAFPDNAGGVDPVVMPQLEQGDEILGRLDVVEEYAWFGRRQTVSSVMPS